MNSETGTDAVAVTNNGQTDSKAANPLVTSIDIT